MRGHIRVRDGKRGTTYQVVVFFGVDRAALACGIAVAADAYVFAQDVAGAVPWHPDHFGHQWARLRKKIGLEQPSQRLSREGGVSTDSLDVCARLWRTASRARP